MRRRKDCDSQADTRRSSSQAARTCKQTPDVVAAKQTPGAVAAKQTPGAVAAKQTPGIVADSDLKTQPY